MVGRRGLFGGAVAIAAMVLSGCGLFRADLGESTAMAAESVDGVDTASLEMVTGATFERILRGTVEIDTADRSAGLTIWDAAMREIVIAVSESDYSTPENIRVGGVRGLLRGGEELDALDLVPDMPTSSPRLDRVTAGAFYAKYGIG